MSWTLSTSGAAIYKSGANHNTVFDGTTGYTILTNWSDQVEAQLNSLSGYDWVANFASLQTNFKSILDDTVSDILAMRIINYDMSGYTSRTEAQTMLDVIRDNLTRCTDILKSADAKTKIGVT